jgi:hypothetical protein
MYTGTDYGTAGANMMQMNAMMGVGAGMMGGMMMSPNYFLFAGNSLSLQSRLESINDADS